MIKNNKKCIFIALLILIFALFSFYVHQNMDLLVDSDMSSELVLSQILAKEKTLLTDSWFYSTELRVFNTQYIFAPLFLLTNNYHIVRTVGSLILNVMLLFSFIYACRSLEIKHIPFLSVFILGCFTKDYFDFYIKAPHYIPYLLICFLTIGLIFEDKKIKPLKLIIVFVLALVSSMNGIRQLTAIYLPLFATSILELFESVFIKRKPEFSNPRYVLSYAGITGSVIGYLINTKVLSVRYNIQADQWKLVLAIPGVNKIKEVIYGWISSFGYTNCISLIYSYITLFISALSVIGLVVIGVNMIIDEKYSRKDRFVLKFAIISIVEMTCVFLLTDMTVITRYFSLNAITCVFVLGIYISRTKTIRFNRKLLCSLLAVFIVINSIIVAGDEIKNSKNGSLVKIKNILIEENCQNGYASFWDANILTELSDGRIEVWMFRNTREGFPSDIYELSDGEWLQKKSHFTRIPEGKVFIVLSNDYSTMFEKEYDVYEKYVDEGKKLLIFENFNEMKEIINR